MIDEGFENFVNTHIKCFDKYKEVPAHFVGSVAYYFQDQLRKVCEDANIEVGNIIKKPIDGLVDFHFKYMNERLRF